MTNDSNIGENREIANGLDLKAAEKDSQFFGELPKGWILKKFGDILSEPVRNGIYKKKEFHGRGLKIINMGELFAYNFISNQEMKRVELNPNEISKSIVQDGDLLFARRSLVLEGSGKCSLVVNPSENLTFESSIIRARPDKTQANPKFYYYLFQSSLGRALMASISTRTAVSGITGSNLVLLKIPQPPISEQNKIASILSSYDDLIENNTRRIKILEEMAQALYREWFVKFRFPGHETVRMVESELGKIPEGWEVKNLFEAAEVTYGFPFKSKLFTQEPLGKPVIRIRDINSQSSKTFTPEEPDDKYLLKNGDLLVGMDGDFHMDKWAGGVAYLNQRVVRFRPKSGLSAYYLFLALKSPIDFFDRTVVGTTVAHLSDEDLRSIYMALPNAIISEKVMNLLDELFKQELNLRIKNTNLRLTRDLLLPKLISGEVDVKKLDINIPKDAA